MAAESGQFCIEGPECVSVLALTENREVLLVEQLRPAIGIVTQELPSGHVDRGELPEEAARRELLEETGYQAGSLELICHIYPDTGRLAYRNSCYFAPIAHAQIDAVLESAVKPVIVPVNVVLERVRTGVFDHAPHLAMIAMAHMRGLL